MPWQDVTPQPAKAHWLNRASLSLAIFGISLFGVVWLHGTQNRTPAAAERTPEPRGPLVPAERARIELFKSCAPSVVHVTAEQVRRSYLNPTPMRVNVGTGSGFVWDKQGHIVTNYHVVANARVSRRGGIVGRVYFDEPMNSYPARLMGIAPDKDLAILKVEVPENLLNPIRIGQSSDLEVGQDVIAIGNPFGLDRTLTTGVISATGREITSIAGQQIVDVIQTDAAINPGNSGGPLFDSSGRLIGVNTAIYSPSGASAGIGFAIPVDTVRRTVPDLIKYGEIRAPRLGVVIRELRRNRGVMIFDIPEGSNAGKAGLRPLRENARGEVIFGDIIEKVDDRPVRTQEDLLSILSDHKAGERVEVEVFSPSSGERRTVQVELMPPAR